MPAALWKVGLAGKEQQELVLDGLELRFRESVAEKNSTLIHYEFLQGMRNLYAAIGDEIIRRKVLALIEIEADPKYRKKYLDLWRTGRKVVIWRGDHMTEHHLDDPVFELRVALTTGDYDRLVKFYCDGLGIQSAQIWNNGQGLALMLEMSRGALEIFDEAQTETIDQLEAGRRHRGSVSAGRPRSAPPAVHVHPRRLRAHRPPGQEYYLDAQDNRARCAKALGVKFQCGGGAS